MEQKERLELTDQELLDKAKKAKYNAMLNAVVIGLMIGVVVWSVVKNTVGLFTLIPLFFAYKMLTSSKGDDRALEEQLKERNLK